MKEQIAPVSARFVNDTLLARVKKLFPDLSDKAIQTQVAVFRGGGNTASVNEYIKRAKAAGVLIEGAASEDTYQIYPDRIRRIPAFKGEEFPSLCVLVFDPASRRTMEKPITDETVGMTDRNIDPKYGLDWNEVKHDAIRDAARRMFGRDY